MEIKTKKLTKRGNHSITFYYGYIFTASKG